MAKAVSGGKKSKGKWILQISMDFRNDRHGGTKAAEHSLLLSLPAML